MAPKPPSFVILVIAGLSNAPNKELPRMRDRRLVTVTVESLQQFQAETNPGDAASPEWLGLTWLVGATAPHPHITVKVWDVSKRELLRDILRAVEVSQTVLFKRVYSECLGSFGSNPIGLIVADLYLTSERSDIEIAKGLAYVAAAAGAPALIGVSPDFPTPGAWPALREHRDFRYLFPLMPRWRRTGRDADGPWLHPGYLIAARAATLRAGDFADAAANLLPRWLPAQADASAATGADVPCDVELEFAFHDPECDELRRAGVTAVSVSALSRPDAFAMLPSAVLRSRSSGAYTLAHSLLTGCVYHHLQDSVRRHRRGDSGAALSQVVHDWFAAHSPVNSASDPLLGLRLVTIVPNKLQVAIVWHPDACRAVEDIELSVPGIVDDSVNGPTGKWEYLKLEWKVQHRNLGPAAEPGWHANGHYRKDLGGDDEVMAMNTLGQEGWELIGVTDCYYFKRQIR